MAEPGAAGRLRFPGISSDAFVSPLDRQALSNLESLPMLPVLVRKFNEYALDQLYYVRNSAESVRCGPRQFGSLYAMLREACAILDTPEPELYLTYSERYNAMTAGVRRTFVTLHSSIVNDFTDDELMYVIGHELGHVKCGHVLYSMLARLLIPLLDTVGQMTLGVGRLAGLGLVAAFCEWLRQAEVTCDRAGLLVCQDPQVAFSATMKLGAGATRYGNEMSVETFLEQARTHAEDSAGLTGASKALLFLFYTWQLDHPQVVFRAKFLDEWIASGAYARILSGDYARAEGPGPSAGPSQAPQAPCPRCGTAIPAGARFCTRCGAPKDPADEEPI